MSLGSYQIVKCDYGHAFDTLFSSWITNYGLWEAAVWEMDAIINKSNLPVINENSTKEMYNTAGALTSWNWPNDIEFEELESEISHSLKKTAGKNKNGGR